MFGFHCLFLIARCQEKAPCDLSSKHWQLSTDSLGSPGGALRFQRTDRRGQCLVLRAQAPSDHARTGTTGCWRKEAAAFAFFIISYLGTHSSSLARYWKLSIMTCQRANNILLFLSTLYFYCWTLVPEESSKAAFSWVVCSQLYWGWFCTEAGFGSLREQCVIIPCILLSKNT